LRSGAARTALLYALPAGLLLGAWLGLGDGDRSWSSGAAMAALALLPALAPGWRARLAAAALVTPLALSRAFDAPLGRGFPRELAHDLREGSLAFWDVSLPFPAAEEPLMHGVTLAAVFAFGLVVSLALAWRRPLLASGALAAGAAWPATMVVETNRVAAGALILGACLAMLAWGGRRPARAARPAVLAGAVVVAAALVAGAQPAVAKGEFLQWKRWDPYDKPADPVGVDYVWDASYDGIKFPDTPTDVLVVTGPEQVDYWRAGTLDEFRAGRWVEAPALVAVSSERQQLTGDPLLPARARSAESIVRATVEVKALRDDHLVAPGTPIVLDPRGIGTVEYRTGNVAVVDGGLERGDRYVVWSYVPRPRPRDLAAVPPLSDRRNTLQSPFLQVAPGIALAPFAAAGRDAQVRSLASNPRLAPRVVPYLPLYRRALAVAGGARTQYAAVVALEAWFRTGGGFRYSESPPRLRAGAPLVDFVERTRAGYCQHYAGAMALMLRYLGIPARVAVGFTAGKHDEKKASWTVRDTDAHAWVEVWFEGWGWLNFDPTPTRGAAESPYANASAIPGVQSEIGAIVRQELRRGSQPTGPAEGTQAAGGRDVPGDLAGTVGAAARTGGSLVRLLALLLVAALALVAVAKVGRRRARYLTRDPRRLAAAARAELADFLLDQGLVVPRSATPHELAALLQRELRLDGARFAAALATARYAQPERAAEAARRARSELRSLERLLRKRLTNAERARGFVSVRSLGLGSAA
jgi:transglutaminase-like putative cysteine protease